MREAGYTFTVEKPDVDESFPKELPIEQVAKYLASKKAEYFRKELHEEVVITADTVVILNKEVLNKPADRDEAIIMLSQLSGKTHLVITGVCILSKEKEESFDDTTEVTFKKLTRAEIEFYVDTYKPYDKAGMVAIEKIVGSYFNVMGLPMHKVYDHMKEY
jgi:septum formation protein